MKSGVGGLKFHEISFRLKFHIQALHETYTYTYAYCDLLPPVQ